MLHIEGGRTGVAPGTTTFTLGATDYDFNTWAATDYVGRQDPGVVVRNVEGRLLPAPVGARARDLGDVPNEFQLSKLYGYLPIINGGPFVGQLSGALSADEEMTRLSLIKAAAEAEKAAEEAKHTRALRIWTAVAAMTGVGGLIVSIVSLTRRK